MSSFQLQAVWFLSWEGLGVPAQLSGSHSLVKAASQQVVKSFVLQCWLLSCCLGLPVDRQWVGQLLLHGKVQQSLEGDEDRSVFAVFVAPFVPIRCGRLLK